MLRVYQYFSKWIVFYKAKKAVLRQLNQREALLQDKLNEYNNQIESNKRKLYFYSTTSYRVGMTDKILSYTDSNTIKLTRENVDLYLLKKKAIEEFNQYALDIKHQIKNM